VKPQLVTTALIRGSKAATNRELCPPSECPITPMRAGSTSGSAWSRSTARRWFQIPFIVALTYPLA
jgi:hypothetical protein